MNILWLCNTVPAEICDILGFKKKYYEGWISGMLNAINQYADIDLSLCVPISNLERMKDGETSDYRFYSFHSIGIEHNSNEEQVERFSWIIRDSEPDVVHIWGSEYGATLSMVNACDRVGIKSRVVVHIQGLASAIVPYTSVSIPSEWINHIGGNGRKISDDNEQMIKRGLNEITTLKAIQYVLGRTEWDRSYIRSVNKSIRYRYCGEVLREKFYRDDRRWDVANCKRHSIFITQGGYAIKGIHLIIPAIAMLKEKYTDIRVFISGNSSLSQTASIVTDPYSEYLKALMEKYAIEDTFEFIGALESGEMIERYLSANILVVPSTIENSSNSIGEAQLLGVPVVASYTGGTPSLIEHTKTGLLYQMDADYMFVSCVEHIFDDDAFAMELSLNEHEVARKRYDPKTVSEQLYNIYKEVVSV
ncbi:glycosyltransferase family 4 protein [Butyrivibrio sp. WCE2006]|uniref:glycosyltransferase family 4 protein n=1 Tax=Butyrivibrio sp. WCE2006 TaxID=1410611 RepID=UPI0005D267FC|nr:glycosyltransferase family 4 protein [Butyrivibrio sp. WCE2006]